MATKYLDSTGLSYLWGKIKTYLSTNYQAKLTSGTNIKTINNTSLLGSGNITIEGGGGVSASMFTVRSASSTASFTGNRTFTLTAPTVSGYTPIAFLNWNLVGTTQTYCYGIGAQDDVTEVTLKLRNTGSSASITAYAFWLYVKTS